MPQARAGQLQGLSEASVLGLGAHVAYGHFLLFKHRSML